MLLAGCIALSALALGFALFRRGSGAELDRQALVLDLYRARREELRRELPSEEIVTEVHAELDAALLDDLVERPQEASYVSASRMPVMIATVLVLAVSIAAYFRVGDPTASALVGAQKLLQSEPSDAELEIWRQRLDDRVTAKPEDAQSWYLRGHLLMQKGEYAQAAESFSQAHAIQGDDPSIDAYWLQARYMAAEGRLDKLSVEIAERLVEQNPRNTMVLELLAVERYRSGDFANALKLLNRALSATSRPEAQVALSQLISRVRGELGATSPAIAVSVTALEAPPEGATVFVIARPVGGGMPYAVVRRPAVLLPLEVQLDDLVSMNPAMPLSSAGQVEVVVRLSLNGQPLAQDGDWQWQSGPLSLANEGVQTLSAELRRP